MFRIGAPFQSIQTTTILPNPSFGEQENLRIALDVHRSMSGVLRTYISRGGNRKTIWSFVLDRKKGIELREFIFAYHASEMLIEDHMGRRWRGMLSVNPAEIRMSGRWGEEHEDLTKNEKVEVTLEFIAELLTPDARSPIKHSMSSVSSLEMSQQVTPDSEVTTNALLHNWDATKITPQADNTRLSAWNDSVSGGINLETYSDHLSASDPGINYSPFYQTKIFGNHPGVYFTSETGDFNEVSTAMRTEDDTQVFRDKRGTMFWVFSHNLGNLPGDFELWGSDDKEHVIWDFEVDDEIQYSFNVVGGANVFAPAVFNILGDTTTGTPKLHGLWQTMPRGHTLIYCLQRDSHTNLRFRVNGVEKDGRLIPDHLSVDGRLRFGVGETSLHGWMGQILVYETVLDDETIESVENTLANKWGACLGTDIQDLGDCFPHLCRSFPQSCSNDVPNFDTSSINQDCDCS